MVKCLVIHSRKWIKKRYIKSIFSDEIVILFSSTHTNSATHINAPFLNTKRTVYPMPRTNTRTSSQFLPLPLQTGRRSVSVIDNLDRERKKTIIALSLYHLTLHDYWMIQKNKA